MEGLLTWSEGICVIFPSWLARGRSQSAISFFVNNDDGDFCCILVKIAQMFHREPFNFSNIKLFVEYQEENIN